MAGFDRGRHQASLQGPVTASVATRATTAADMTANNPTPKLAGKVCESSWLYAPQPPHTAGNGHRDSQISRTQCDGNPPRLGRAVARAGGKDKQLRAESSLADDTLPTPHRVRIEASAHSGGTPSGTRSLA